MGQAGRVSRHRAAGEYQNKEILPGVGSLLDDGTFQPIGTVEKGNGRSYPTFAIAAGNTETTPPAQTGTELFQ